MPPNPPMPPTHPDSIVAVAPMRTAAPMCSATTRRWIGLAFAVPALAVLLLAAYLRPNPAGLGTHVQLLNMPACGWIALMKLPCPTCGMTTAFAHAADGNLLRSFRTQPLGALLAVVTGMVLLLGTFVAITGSRIASVLRRLWRPYTGWLLAGLVLAAWGYKIVSYKGLIG